MLKVCKIKKIEIFLEDYHNINFQTLSKSSFFKEIFEVATFLLNVFFAITKQIE